MTRNSITKIRINPAIPVRHLPSAGGVILRKAKGALEVLVVQRAAMKDTSLPKGGCETNESLQETSIREIQEETGVIAKPVCYIGSFTYQSFSNDKKVQYIRTAHWFLMTTRRMIIKRGANSEIRASVWLSIREGLKLLTYATERDVLRAAVRLARRESLG